MVLSVLFSTPFLLFFLVVSSPDSTLAQPPSQTTVAAAPSSSSAFWSFLSWSSLFPSRKSPPGHRFISEEKLINLDSLGLPKTGTIASWGDFNSDQSLDVVHLAYDQRSISVWNWDKVNYAWTRDDKLSIKTRSDFVVTNVVAGDFDRDGKLDLLLMGQPHPGWYKHKKNDKLDMLLYLQTMNGSFTDPITLDSSTLPQPIVFDALGTMTTSLLGFSPDSPSSTPLPQLWIPHSPSSSPSASPATSSFEFQLEEASSRFDFSSHPSGQWQCQFPAVHFNQFLDLDGDCLADLFLTCLDEEGGQGEGGLRYEIWINEKRSRTLSKNENLSLSSPASGDDLVTGAAGGGETRGAGTSGLGEGKFVWKRGGKLPKGTKSVSFADMDRDGTLDMILSVCPNKSTDDDQNGKKQDKDCTIEIVYNDQIPLCSSTSSAEAECRDIENLCIGDPNFGFNLTRSDDNASLSSFVVSKDLIPSHNLLTNSLAFRGDLPVRPQVGDYNIDGYPDLLLLVSPQLRPSERVVRLLQSRPCTLGKCTEGEVKKGRRWYEVVEGDGKGVEELEKFRDVETVHWLDLDDDGSLDIVLQRSGQSGAARQINFIKNNFFNDAFFLKAMVLNGACQNWCEPKEPGQSRYHPYGSSYSGASYKFTVLDPTGARRSTQYAQLPSTSYLSLSLPYAHLGLGRTNNYVENLFIGSTRSHQSNHFINLEGVIPNSQVLILPFQSREVEPPRRGEEEGSTGDGGDQGEQLWEGDVGEWRKELYLKPGDWIPWVTLVLLTAILGLGIVVFVLHSNEKREDEVERRARLLSLNFGAL